MNSPHPTENLISGLAVQARGLSKCYTLGRKRVEVLKGVDFSVGNGEFVAVLGASGAGKSTLLHLLAGLDTPDSGSITFNGEPLAARSANNLAVFRREKVGLVFQSYHLLHELDALENVCLPARMGRKNPTEVVRHGRDLLSRVGLSERLDHRPYELSGGEQQRVAIARALINDPEILIADEPTGNLDSKTGGEIIQLLFTLHSERQMSLVIATHDQRVAAKAERIVQLVDGTLGSGQ